MATIWQKKIFSVQDTGATIGTRAAGVDYSLIFNGESNQGSITYDEDSDVFNFSSAVSFAGGGSSHAPATVLDTSSINFSITGQQITGVVLPAGVDHNSLANLTTGDYYTQYVKKAGDTMTGDLNFTAKGINTADYVNLNNVYSATGSEPVGSIHWNTVDGTMNVTLYNGSILQMGQELYFYGKASGNIANGELCEFAGVQGDHILMKKAVASEIITYPHYMIGVATQNITSGNYGYVTWFGKVNNVYTKTPANNDTADWAAGDILYFNNSTGQLTKTAPTAPNRRIIVAAVIKEQTGSSENGIIIVRPTLGCKLEDIDDVDGSAPNATGDLLTWNNTSSVWERNSYNITDYATLADIDFLDNEKLYFGTGDDMSIYYDGTSGYIKTSEVAAGDLHITTGTAKTIVYDTAVAEDLNFDPTRSGGPVATRPDSVTINNVLHTEFTSANNQLCGAVQEVPHNYKLSTNLYPHIHIFLKGGESAGTTGVTFTFYWELRQSTGTTSGSIALSATSANLGTTAGTNKFDIFDATGFTGSAELGAQLACTIARTGGDAGDVVVTTYGVHYYKDTPGSRTLTSK